MSDKLITDGTYALSVKEYTGELEPGQGIDITQNVISVTGKMNSDFIQLVATEEEAIAGQTGKIYVVTGTGA